MSQESAQKKGRREPRAGDVRVRILEAATRAFASRGFEGASLESIARAVGIRKASLLYHFESKDSLHQQVLGELLTRWNETLPRLLKAAARKERFDALLSETVAFFLADANRARLLMREVLDRPKRMRELLRTQASSWMVVVAQAIREEQKRGQVRADVDAESWLLNLIHLVVSSTAAWTATGVLLEAEGKAAQSRLTRELFRIARASLIPEGSADRSTEAAPSAEVEASSNDSGANAAGYSEVARPLPEVMGSAGAGADSRDSDPRDSESVVSGSRGLNSKGSGSWDSESKDAEAKIADSKSSDSRESDSPESDSPESGSEESDPEESGSEESDSEESDFRESDYPESDSRESGSRESDSPESDSEEFGCRESDSEESDSEESDSEESDSRAAESSDFKSKGIESSKAHASFEPTKTADSLIRSEDADSVEVHRPGGSAGPADSVDFTSPAEPDSVESFSTYSSASDSEKSEPFLRIQPAARE